MESKKINQLATELSPELSDLTIIGDPNTGISKKITLSQMASLFTGTVEEYASLSAFPLVGAADTIYIALDTNIIYRWNTGTSAYVELSPNIVTSLVFNDANGFDGTISLVGSTATLTITTALTTGSVGFIGASGALLQDNANFFWDNSNKRLGINTNAPTTALDVFGSGIIGRVNGTSTNNAFLGFASAGTNKWSIGNVQSDHRFRIYNEATTSELVSVLQTGEFGIGIANPTTKFHIDGGASALIANLDANVSVAKSISFRSDNSARINLEVSGTESGSNAGADLFIRTYTDAGALLATPLFIKRSTGNIGIGDTDTRNAKLMIYNAGAAGTPHLMFVHSSAATLQREFYSDSSGNFIHSYWNGTTRATHLTINTTGASTFVDDITITKASTASFILNNTSASGKSYRLLSGDDGIFKIQNTGILDLVSITSTGATTFASNVGINGAVTSSPLSVKVATNQNVRISSQTSTSIQAVNDAASSFVTLKLDGSTLLLNSQSNGNVGINTSTATNGKLEVQTSTTTAALWAQTGGTTTSHIIADFRTGSNLSALQINGAGYSYFSSYVEITTSGNGLRINAPATYSAISIGGNGSFGIDYPGIGNGRFSISDNGNVGMPRTYGFTTSNAANLFIDSNGLLYRSSSSLKYKKNVEDLTINTTDLLSKMRPVWYRSLGDLDREDWSWYGFIAEELALIEPRLVHFGYKKDCYEEVEVLDKEGNIKTEIRLKKNAVKDEPEGVQYERITVLLVAELQKMRKELDELKAK